MTKHLGIHLPKVSLASIQTQDQCCRTALRRPTCAFHIEVPPASSWRDTYLRVWFLTHLIPQVCQHNGDHPPDPESLPPGSLTPWGTLAQPFLCKGLLPTQTLCTSLIPAQLASFRLPGHSHCLTLYLALFLLPCLSSPRLSRPE